MATGSETSVLTLSVHACTDTVHRVAQLIPDLKDFKAGMTGKEAGQGCHGAKCFKK